MNNARFRILIYLLVAASFIAKGAISLDSDFGWHLEVGKLISQKSLPLTDPFSYSMPSYPYIDHEWLTNLFIFWTYHLSGKFTLSLIAGVFSLSSLLIAIKNPLSRRKVVESKTFSLINYTLLLLGASVILRYSGIRPQVESWLFLAVLLRVILDRKAWEKWKFTLPAFFILWANLHASFVAGLAAWFSVIALRSIRIRKINKFEIWVLGLSILGTLVNPYGIKLWPRVLGEMWLQVSEPSLRWAINEWTPTFMSIRLPLIVYIPFSFAFIWMNRQRLFLEEKGIFLIFFLLSMISTRHVPLWIIVSLPLAHVSISLLYQDLKGRLARKKFRKAIKVVFLVSLFVFILESILTVSGARYASEGNYYPQKAVSYLRSNLPKGQIFSEYSWGGYLIWMLPEKKVFIDGRMPSWRQGGDLASESQFALDDYRNIILGIVSYEELFDKYQIDTVLFPRPSEVAAGSFNLVNKISKDGWEKVYEDNVSAIFKKPN